MRVWYMHSSYSGHRLYCEYINKDASFRIELICDSRRELNEYEDAFSFMATTFEIKAVDATARSSIVGATSTAPPHHL